MHPGHAQGFGRQHLHCVVGSETSLRGGVLVQRGVVVMIYFLMNVLRSCVPACSIVAASFLDVS